MGAVRLTIVENEGAAEILCHALRAEGIACGYRSTDHGAGHAEGGYSFGGMREVLVEEADYLRATEILESSGPVVDECARCGRPLDESGGWFQDEAGELQPYCGVCADRLLG